MAIPTITRLSRTSDANEAYWGPDSTKANYDPRVLSGNNGFHLYAVDGTEYTYAELFEALRTFNHSGSGNTDFSITITNNAVSATTSPSRTFEFTGYNEGNHTGVIMLRTGRLFHEIPGTSYVHVNADQIALPFIASPATVVTGDSVSTASLVYGDTDGPWTASTELTLGNVIWTPGQSLYQLSNFGNSGNRQNIQPVDFGDPTKTSQPSALLASLATFCPSATQSATVTDRRLTIAYSDGRRWDPDICGQGQLNVSMNMWKTGTTGGFIHNTNSNPRSSVVAYVQDTYIGAAAGGSAVTQQRTPDGAFEVISATPVAARHTYLDADGMKTSSAIDIANDTPIRLGSQVQSALTGSGRFQGASEREGIVLQGIKSAYYRYFKSVFSRSDVTDILHLDPAVQFTGSNAPFLIQENSSGAADASKDTVYLRSLGVNNQDASGVGKSSLAYVIGNQRSANRRTYRSGSDGWLADVVPQLVADSDTFSVRRTDAEGVGNAGIVGRGVHYLHDATWHADTGSQGNNANLGGLASNYTQYSDSDNDTYLVHRGGIQRIQQNISLRSTPWNFNSVGSTGQLYSNSVDDIPGLTDNLINMFKDGLIGTATSDADIISNQSGTVVIDGLTNLTDLEVRNMVGASLIVTTGRATITDATRTNSTTVSLDVTAGSNGFGQDDNASATILWDADSGYRWTVNTTNNREILISVQANYNITWDYTALAAILQAKIEKVAFVRQSQHNNPNGLFGSGNDSTYGGSNIDTQALLSTMLQHTESNTNKSFCEKNTTTGTTLDILRLLYSVNTSSTLTLNPDEFITSLNYGSSFTVPARVTHNGSYTDSNGTPNFIDVIKPDSVSDTDVSVAVAYQAFRPLTTYLSYQGIQSGAINFDTNGTLVSGEWQAVTRPSATGTDTLLSTLPTSWDWSTSSNPVQRVIIRQDSSITSALRSTLQTWINGSSQNYVVAVDNGLTEYAIYEASEASLQGSAIAMNLRLLTSSGNPDATNVSWYFNVNADGAAVTNTSHNGNWQIGATPSITTVGTRSFVQVSSTDSNTQETNSTGVWYLSFTGGEINPVRQMYTGNAPAGSTVTLTVDSLRPASSAVAKSGDITVVPYTVTSPGSNSEVKTLLTEDTEYPSEQIEDVNRLGLFINSYNSATDANRTKIDVGDALNSPIVAKYVAAYGTDAISDIVRVSDANLLDTHWRIRYDGVSKIDFLKMDGILPVTLTTDSNYFEVDPADNDAVCFFDAPTYSAAEVQGVVEALVTNPFNRLASRQANASLGIPVPNVTITD